VASKRVADMSPEEAERHRAKARDYRKKYRATEAGRAKLIDISKRYRERNLEDQRKKDSDRYRRKYWADPEKSRAQAKLKHERRPDIRQRADRRRLIREASHRTANQLMREISKRAPRLDCRDEIVSVTALLVCEGVRLGDAVRRATKIALKDQDFTKYSSVPVEECFWLCEEPEEIENDPEKDWLIAAYLHGPATHPLHFRA
jgi:hypothetical protein